jgi:hypothetical protein
VHGSSSSYVSADKNLGTTNDNQNSCAANRSDDSYACNSTSRTSSYNESVADRAAGSNATTLTNQQTAAVPNTIMKVSLLPLPYSVILGSSYGSQPYCDINGRLQHIPYMSSDGNVSDEVKVIQQYCILHSFFYSSSNDNR